MREGSRERAIDWLSKEHERTPSDLVVALLLSEARRPVDPGGAARALLRAAAAVDDSGLAAALWLEGGLLLWRAGQRHDAVAAFESASGPAPVAARRVLSWALRAANPDDRALRRRVAEFDEAAEDARAVGALERFGLGILEKGGEAEAWSALEQLDALDESGDVALAAALARLLWANDATEPATFAAALERIEPLGGDSTRLVHAERFRRARFVERDLDAAREAAKVWASQGPSMEAGLAWLATASAASDRVAEVDARRVVAGQLEGEPRVQALASAALLAKLHGRTEGIALFDPSTTTARLLNLELALPGSAPGRRVAALTQLGDALGDEARQQALRLAGWSELARGAHERAKDTFATLCRHEPTDIPSWEGLRAAAEALSDDVALGAALMQLGTLSRDTARGAELLELAGATLLDRTAAHQEGEDALVQALARDPKRGEAFERLFKRYRERNHDEGLLALIAKRIEVTDDTGEMTRMYWERARVLRRRGDIRGALSALENVSDIEPDHVGALALLGEIRINTARGIVEAGGDATREFAEAAPILARLAALPSAPEQQRRVSAVAATDVYEKQLGRPEKAFDVLSRLHRDRLATLALRERLARLAGRTGKWRDAAKLLEELMVDRLDSEGRADAARLAMAIHRDKLNDPPQAERAVTRLLEECPDDPDAIEVVLRAPLAALKPLVLQGSRTAVETRLAEHPTDVRRIRVLADLAAAAGQVDAHRAALGVLAAIVDPDESLRQSLLRLDTRVAHVPSIALDDRALGIVCDPADEGPLAELFALVAEVVSAALGPSLRTEGLSRRERIEAGDPLRVEVARWMGAVGFDDFELYLGGRRRRGVAGVADELPTLIVGDEVQAPLDAASRAAVAREAFALRRGITAVLHNDDHTILSVVASVSNEVGVPMPPPPFAIYKEVDRAVRKAMNRKLRKEAAALCASLVSSGVEVGPWLAAARRSVDRMALLAAGDAGIVLDSIAGSRGTPSRLQWERNPRAVSLLRFALSREYLDLRRRLGMGTP
ncbi:MAG: hypothetical protein FJ096_03965 [Deltaproteobacteria bacterium]|nr:hypothetical protein [Deltaproteobacteria bacterium]